MWWRLTGREYERSKGETNKRAFREIVAQGRTPGLLAYIDSDPVGWCAVETRECFPRLARSPVLKPVDERPVWSVPCFFIEKRARGRGVARALLEAAVAFVASRGGSIVEGYPVEPRKSSMPDLYAFPGVPSLFEQVGFEEVARRSETRPIMRRYL